MGVFVYFHSMLKHFTVASRCKEAIVNSYTNRCMSLLYTNGCLLQCNMLPFPLRAI